MVDRPKGNQTERQLDGQVENERQADENMHKQRGREMKNTDRERYKNPQTYKY
jgi:hypothetical protein